MTLNASGPISLGGSTTGQSINLELGQSATATTSLNASNVRTLLQVPSGQISLSNAYGKSNATAFIVSLGLQSVSTPSVTSVPIRGWGWDCSPSGVTAWKMGSDRYIAFMSADGTTYTNTQITSAASADCYFGPTINRCTSGSVFTVASNFNNCLNVNYGSSNSYAQPLGTLWGTGSTAQGPALASYIDSSGNVTGIWNANEDKYGSYLFCIRVNSAGTNLSLYTTIGFSGLATNEIRRVFQRTDGTWLVAYGGSSVTNWRTYNSDFSSNTGRFNSSLATGASVSGLEMDSSNNLYSYYQSGTVLKINSANALVSAYNYSAVANSYASGVGKSGIFGISIYNDVLYIATNGIQDNSSSANPYWLNIIAISCSSMTTVLWNRQFYFNSNEIRPMSCNQGPFNPGQGNAIKATSAGLYVAFTVGTGVSGEVFCMNLPLTTGISNQTTSIAFKGGGSVPMTVTTPTNTTSSVGMGTVNTTSGQTMTPGVVRTLSYTSSSFSPGLSGLKTTVTV